MMKKLALFSLVAVVAAACADSPTMPNAGDPLLSHVTQTGSAYHGYDAPFVEEPVVDGNDVTLCADWTDSELAGFVEANGGVLTGNPPNHYSFEYEVWDADANEGEGAWVPVATVNGALGDQTGQDGCLDLVLDDGTYLFRVKSTAHVSIAGERTNHHTEWAEFEVVVGLEYSINIVGGSAGDGDFAKNANSFNITYELLLGDDVVTDCSVVVTVTTDLAGAVQQHNNCDSETGERQVQFSNPDKGEPVSGSVTFSLDGDDLLVFGVSSS
jgi:hypothetical protein